MKIIILLEQGRPLTVPPIMYAMPDTVSVVDVRKALVAQKLDAIYVAHELGADMIDVMPTAGLLAKNLRRVEDEVKRSELKIRRAMARAERASKKVKKANKLDKTARKTAARDA